MTEFDNPYISAKELKMLIPQISIKTARNIITECREELALKNEYLIQGKTKIAPTEMVLKKLHIKRK